MTRHHLRPIAVAFFFMLMATPALAGPTHGEVAPGTSLNDAPVLAGDTTDPGAAAPDLRLTCRGNEPFWRLEVDGGKAHFARFADDWPAGRTYRGTLEVLDWARPPRFVWRGGSNLLAPLIAVGRVEPCRDTMADLPPSAWSVVVSDPNGRPLIGCCGPPG